LASAHISGGNAADEVAAVQRFLTDRLGSSIRGLTKLAGGEWSSAFAFDHDGRRLVARFSATDEDFRKDERIGRRHPAALPVPRILEIGPASGGFYALSDWVDGVDLETVDESNLRSILSSLLGVLDAIRSFDLGDSRGFGSWDASGNAPHTKWRDALLAIATDRPTQRTHGWLERLRASPTGEGPFRAAYRSLGKLADGLPDTRSLVHSDLLNRNVLVSADRIQAVLDWGSSLYGDFLYDVAWLVFWQPWYPAWSGVDFVDEAVRHYARIRLPVADVETRLRACLIHIGLDGQTYQAFKGRWTDLEQTAARTVEIARARI
jgi:hygromycin-B 4-O-kinase